MRASHIWRFFLVSCLAWSLAGSNAIVATVRLLSLNGRVAEFEVTLSNPGQPSLYLEESLKGSRDLHAVDIEIEDTSHKWVRVGPKRDAAASGVFELGSGQSVSRKVSVYGLTNRQLSLLKNPHPRYRATLRYFQSSEAWALFSRTIGRESTPTTITAQPGAGVP
jgi:hypothetical protein